MGKQRVIGVQCRAWGPTYGCSGVGFEIWSTREQSLNCFRGTKAGSGVSATSAQLEGRELGQGQAAPVGPVREVGQATWSGFCHIVGTLRLTRRSSAPAGKLSSKAFLLAGVDLSPACSPAPDFESDLGQDTTPLQALVSTIICIVEGSSLPILLGSCS